MTAEGWLVVWLMALGAGSVFSALAQSLRDLSRTTMDTILGDRGDEGLSSRIRAILDESDEHATAVTLPRVACNLLVVVAMVMWLTGLRGAVSPGWIEIALGTVGASLLVWILGSVIPSAIANHAAERTVIVWSRAIRGIYWITTPLRGVYTLSDMALRRLTGRAAVTEAQDIHEEIRSVVEEAKHGGQIDQSEQDMIDAVVRFREMTVAEVMTPRAQIRALKLTNNLGEVTQFIRRGGHSRIPVYEGDLDHVVGVFYVKDLMRWLAGDRRGGTTFDLRSLLRPAIFVPETKTVRELLGELVSKKVHIAIVADEYGGTAGLVTIEDVVELVFGEIQDEYEAMKDEPPEVRVDESAGHAEVDAAAYIEDVNEALRGLGLSIPESDDYDTVGGFVTVTLGRIPSAGEEVTHDGLVMRILGAEPTRVTRVRLAAAGAKSVPGGR